MIHLSYRTWARVRWSCSHRNRGSKIEKKKERGVEKKRKSRRFDAHERTTHARERVESRSSDRLVGRHVLGNHRDSRLGWHSRGGRRFGEPRIETEYQRWWLLTIRRACRDCVRFNRRERERKNKEKDYGRVVMDDDDIGRWFVSVLVVRWEIKQKIAKWFSLEIVRMRMMASLRFVPITNSI